MKTSHKGFAIPALVLVAALAIGGGLIIKERSKLKESTPKPKAENVNKKGEFGEFEKDIAAIDAQLKGINNDIEQSNKTE
jgi:hypothetical protein